MLRMIGFFVLAVLLAQVLAYLPVIGPLFQRMGCLGIWVAAILLSWAFTRISARAVVMRRGAAEVRRLTAVPSPYNCGKLGALYLSQGRARRALEPLQTAVAGEPDVAEWHYRLGLAYQQTGAAEEALAQLGRCLEIDEEYAYGKAQMSLAELLLRTGRHPEALEALVKFERNHGPTPESAYRRGGAHRSMGDKQAARAAFDEVAGLASHVLQYQRQAAAVWSLRAKFARLL